MKARVLAKPSRSVVALYVEGSEGGPSIVVHLDPAEAERVANELKDAVKEALLWNG